MATTLLAPTSETPTSLPPTSPTVVVVLISGFLTVRQVVFPR